MKKQPSKSHKKPAPAAEKTKEPAQKKPNKEAGGAGASNIETKGDGTEQEEHEAKSEKEAGSRRWVAHSYSTPSKDVHVVMPADIAKHHGDPSNPEGKSYSAIRERFQHDIHWLLRRAVRGERNAIQILAELGIDSAAALGILGTSLPELVKCVARTFSEWPVVTTCFKPLTASA